MRHHASHAMRRRDGSRVVTAFRVQLLGNTSSDSINQDIMVPSVRGHARSQLCSTSSPPTMAAESSAAPRSARQKVTRAGPQALTTVATLLPRPVLPTQVTAHGLGTRRALGGSRERQCHHLHAGRLTISSSAAEMQQKAVSVQRALLHRSFVSEPLLPVASQQASQARRTGRTESC